MLGAISKPDQFVLVFVGFVCFSVLSLDVEYNHIRIVMEFGMLETSFDLCRVITMFS